MSNNGALFFDKKIVWKVRHDVCQLRKRGLGHSEGTWALGGLLKGTRALKVGPHLPKKNFFIWFNDNPSEMMKNAFYFILKALFVLMVFKLLS